MNVVQDQPVSAICSRQKRQLERGSLLLVSHDSISSSHRSKGGEKSHHKRWMSRDLASALSSKLFLLRPCPLTLGFDRLRMGAKKELIFCSALAMQKVVFSNRGNLAALTDIRRLLP